MNVLGLFAKRPQPGAVKTRLAAEIGAEPAAEVYAAFLAEIADRLRHCGERRFFCLATEGADERDYFRTLANGGYELWPQPQADLGTRMAAFFEARLAEGAQRVVVVGSDSPTLPPECVERAFAELERHDVVIGPATDGGYYLLGQRERTRDELFRDVDWSGPKVLAQTVARLPAEATLSVLPVWYDVDTRDDLLALSGHLAALERAGADWSRLAGVVQRVLDEGQPR